MSSQLLQELELLLDQMEQYSSMEQIGLSSHIPSFCNKVRALMNLNPNDFATPIMITRLEALQKRIVRQQKLFLNLVLNGLQQQEQQHNVMLSRLQQTQEQQHSQLEREE